MSDELVESAEFGRKKKNEEEPILVAQRFLNIYRQMHIFNKERQEQFDDMLLALPSDIRILLSTLPGGSLLLEHIEEVEHKRGLVSPTLKTENNFRKKNANDLLQTAAPAVNKQEVAAKPAAANAGGGVVIDASFASELSNSLSFALQQTEKRYKDDIRTLTETITRSITESQSAIANMMKDIMFRKISLLHFRIQRRKTPILLRRQAPLKLRSRLRKKLSRKFKTLNRRHRCNRLKIRSPINPMLRRLKTIPCKIKLQMNT